MDHCQGRGRVLGSQRCRTVLRTALGELEKDFLYHCTFLEWAGAPKPGAAYLRDFYNEAYRLGCTIKVSKPLADGDRIDLSSSELTVIRAFLKINSRLMLKILDIPRDMCLFINRGPEVSHSQRGERIPCRAAGGPQAGNKETDRRCTGHYHASHRLFQRAGDEVLDLSESAIKKIIRAFNCLRRRRSRCKETYRTKACYNRRAKRRDYRRVRGTGPRPEDVLDGVCFPRLHH